MIIILLLFFCLPVRHLTCSNMLMRHLTLNDPTNPILKTAASPAILIQAQVGGKARPLGSSSLASGDSEQGTTLPLALAQMDPRPQLPPSPPSAPACPPSSYCLSITSSSSSSSSSFSSSSTDVASSAGAPSSTFGGQLPTGMSGAPPGFGMVIGCGGNSSAGFAAPPPPPPSPSGTFRR